jgi:predicted metal-dependent HD superfamily phosphohydrolase
MTLRDRWRMTWSDLGLPVPPPSVLEDLLARYSEASRAYHTTQHLEECFAQFALASHLSSHSGEVQVALWFHDAIYDTRAQDNEERSANLARESLCAAGVSLEIAEHVHELVMATRHDALPEEPDAQLVVDIDLSILAATTERFTEYEKQIRAEYSWVPEPSYREGRARILASLLGRKSIYSTPWFYGRLEQRARDNLSRSLQGLAV